MAEVESFLWQIVAEIEPTSNQKEGARRSHNHLRDLLCTGQMKNRIIDHYLSGSYARDTAIRPLDDVDIIFVVDPKPWLDGWQALYDTVLPEPSKILDSFANAIRYRYPVSSVYGQRRSVRLSLEHLDIDVVPAVRVSPLDPRVIKVPDSDSNKWILSAPKIHEEKATNVNKKNNGKIKPLIKLLKFWNGNLPSTVKMKSFVIETMAVRVFDTIPCPSLQQGLYIFFDFIAYAGGKSSYIKWNNTCGISMNWFGFNVPDTSGTDTNVAAGVSDDQRNKFIEAAVRSRDKMIEANRTAYDSIAADRVSEALRFK